MEQIKLDLKRLKNSRNESPVFRVLNELTEEEMKTLLSTKVFRVRNGVLFTSFDTSFCYMITSNSNYILNDVYFRINNITK